MARMTPQNPGSQNNPDPIRDLLDEKTLADEITKAIEGNDCPRESDLLAYVKKELGEAERIEVKSHLVFCTRCQGKVKLLEEEPGAKEAAAAKDKGPSPSPTRLPGPWSIARKALAASALALCLAGGLLFFIFQSSGLPYGVKVVHAAGTIPGAEEIQYQVRTPAPIYLIEIMVHGDGQITARIPPGADGTSQFVDGGRSLVQPRARGEVDLYLVPLPVGEGFPNRQLGELLKFIRTEKSLNRENQRRGIQMALEFYHFKFLHEVFTFKG
jgi:hypothetical protein